MDLIYKIFELDNKEKYIVMDSISYMSKTILLLGKLNDSEEVGDFMYAEFDNGNIIKIEDQEIINRLDEIIKMNLN